MVKYKVDKSYCDGLGGVAYLSNNASSLAAYQIPRDAVDTCKKFYRLEDAKLGSLDPDVAAGARTKMVKENCGAYRGLHSVPCVYFLWDLDKRIYVGMSDRGGLERISEHEKGKAWWKTALVIFNKEAAADAGRKILTWSGEPMGYYEEAFWLELDKERYDVDTDEAAKHLRDTCRHDKQADDQKNRYLEDAAIYLMEINCNAMTPALAMREKDRLERLDASVGKGRSSGGISKAEWEMYTRWFGYVPTYYLPYIYAKQMAHDIVYTKWAEIREEYGDSDEAYEVLKRVKILNIACKSRPEFLVCMEEELFSILGGYAKDRRKLMCHIHDKMLFGLALRPDMCQSLREYCSGSYDGERPNIIWLEEYKPLLNMEAMEGGTVNRVARKALEYFREAAGKEGTDMKFDIVVGNAREVFGLTAKIRVNKGFPGHTPLFLCTEIRAERPRKVA